MEELAVRVGTATATDNDAVVAHDEAHSDTSAGIGDANEDSDWGPDSDGCGNEIQTRDSEVNEDYHTVATSINLNDGDLRELVTRSFKRIPATRSA
ncbi:hypothetical protein DVH05_012610 [Phytophthora capsici]|nr:hypothetical protein DVH05_012610 [Phytophthora capsici]